MLKRVIQSEKLCGQIPLSTPLSTLSEARKQMEPQIEKTEKGE